MAASISKGRIFSVTVEVDEERLARMRKAPELTQATMQKTADEWHTKLLPKHFAAGAGAIYGYAARSPAYVKQQHGKPLLVHSGSLRNDLKSTAQYRLGTGSATVDVKMWARVLNFAGQAAGGENSQDLYAIQRPRKHGGLKQPYPNIRREIKLVTEDEREALAIFTAKNIEAAFGPADTKTKASIGGVTGV